MVEIALRNQLLINLMTMKKKKYLKVTIKRKQYMLNQFGKSTLIHLFTIKSLINNKRKKE